MSRWRIWRSTSVAASLIAGAGLLASCNAYQFMDSPSGDAQYLAAAHSCLDQGDYACATQYFLKISSSAGDTQYSERAMARLSQSGIGVGTFASAILQSGSNLGRLITLFADSLSYQASNALRLELFQNYKLTLNIQNTQAQAALRMITALALLAELFAEDASIAGYYTSRDLVDNPSGCITAGALGSFSSEDCAITGKKLSIGLSLGSNATTLSNAVNSDFSSGNATLYMVQATISELNTASNLLGGGSKFVSSALAFVSILLDFDLTQTNADRAYRYLLLNAGLGKHS